jgi:hypothetical protein
VCGGYVDDTGIAYLTPIFEKSKEEDDNPTGKKSIPGECPHQRSRVGYSHTSDQALEEPKKKASDNNTTWKRKERSSPEKGKGKKKARADP